MYKGITIPNTEEGWGKAQREAEEELQRQREEKSE
jgi:hypothetical protein